METFPGLTIDDLNRYLPALQTINDIHMDSNNMKEGMFLTKCLDGLKKLPDDRSQYNQYLNMGLFVILIMYFFQGEELSVWFATFIGIFLSERKNV